MLLVDLHKIAAAVKLLLYYSGYLQEMLSTQLP